MMSVVILVTVLSRWGGGVANSSLSRFTSCLGALTHERILGIMSNISVAETLWSFKFGSD